MAPCREAKEPGYLLRGMALGERHLAPEIVAVQVHQQVVQDAPRAALEFADIVALPGNDGEVRHLLQLRIGPVGRHQTGEVLGRHRPRDGEDQRLLGGGEKAIDDPRGLPARPVPTRRREPGGVGAGRNDRDAPGALGLVEPVLLVGLLLSTGDEERGVSQDLLLDGDAASEVEAALEGLGLAPRGQESRALHASERVTRVDEGHPEEQGDLDPDVTRIAIVCVDHVGDAVLRAQQVQRAVDHLVEVPPQRLLTDVLPRGAEGETQDAGALGQTLLRLCVVFGDIGIVDETGEQIDLCDVGPAGQGASELDDVGGLAAGVGVASELEIVAAKKTVDGDEENTEGVGVHGG